MVVMVVHYMTNFDSLLSCECFLGSPRFDVVEMGFILSEEQNYQRLFGIKKPLMAEDGNKN